MTIELPAKMYPTILCKLKCPNDTTTAVQHTPKAHLGLPTTSWLRPSRFDKHSCPCVGQWPNPTHPCHFHHDLRSTTFTDREQWLFSSRVITNASSSKPRTARHTSNCACNLPEPRPHKECVLQHNSHPVKRNNQPRTCSVHTASAMNRQLWLLEVLSAPGAEIPNQKKVEIQHCDQTENQQFKIRDPPQTTIRSKRSSYRCTSPRF